MILGVSIAEAVWLSLAVIVAGILTGFLAGLFGIGGGGVIVPVLFEIFRVLGVPDNVRMQLCVGTSLAIIGPTTIRSYRAHRAEGLMLTEVVRSWTLPAILGVAMGAVIASFAPAGVFKLAFALIASMIAVRLPVVRESWKLGSGLPGNVPMTGYGFVVGLASSLGVGGGSLVAMVLTLYRYRFTMQSRPPPLLVFRSPLWAVPDMCSPGSCTQRLLPPVR